MILAGTKSRILQFIDTKGIDKRTFFSDTGIKRGLLDSDKLNSTVSDVFLAKILAAYPELNVEWLITGQGEMLKGKTPPPEVTPEPTVVHFEMPNEDYTAIPVVDIEAAAGFGTPNVNYIDESQLIYLPKSMLRGQRDRLCIKVSGDSMEPTLYNNSRIVVRLLDEGDWEYIRDNEIHVVTDREGHTYVKRLTNNLRTAGEIILQSDNENQQLYKPFTMPEEDIFRIWAVELYLVRNVSDPTQQRMTEAAVMAFEKKLAAIENTVERLSQKIEKGQ